MSLVDGIGGVFLFSNNPKLLAEWYRENLSIDYGENSEDGSVYKIFTSRDIKDASVERSTVWAILPSDKDINGKPRTGKINYRVRSMVETLSHLKAKGVAIEKIEDHSYGKFATIADPEGNKIELWEEVT